MKSFIRRAAIVSACVLGASGASAQNSPFGVGALSVPQPMRAPPVSYRQPLSDSDQVALRQAMDAAQAGDVGRADQMRQNLSDPIARKLVLWAMVDAAGERLSFFQLDQARRDLWGWPRAQKRQAAAEKQLSTAGLAPQGVVDWFKGEEPQSAEGAIALASAYQALGRGPDAQALIKHFWRDKSFEVDVQRQMLARFGSLLTVDDHVRRADMLLYGQQGPATQDVIALLPASEQAVARARMAFRQNSSSANAQFDALPATLGSQPGLAFERARYLRQHNLESLALAQAPYMTAPNAEAATLSWPERRALIGVALRNGNFRAAYQIAAESGLPPGSDFAEAEFFAGWLQLTKLHDAHGADAHFARIQQVGTSPITQARALYWRGRASEAAGDSVGAMAFYGQAARFNTTFYGQLAGEKAQIGELTLGHDPAPTEADRARFEGRETVRAARDLMEAGEKDLFRVFVASIDDSLPNCEEYALMVDMIRGYGDQFLSMLVVRSAAQHGFILPDRGYPTVYMGHDPSAPERAFVLGIVRQESSFDPHARSGVGARGMMQLMPSTAAHVAAKIGTDFSASRLDDPEYNIRLGSVYLGSVIDTFGGSYIMAAAAYNAGPGRPGQWAAYCGDPRTGGTDPIDYIECIPFTETRNYVMRVMENVQVYRAKMNGGHAPYTLAEDLKRGRYVYTPSPTTYGAPTNAASTPLTPGQPTVGGAPARSNR